jgi:hypothetical protein
MLAPTMDKWLRWLTRGVHIRLQGRGTTARHDDVSPSYEHIDAALLDDGDFRASESMRLDPLKRQDFAETLPGFACPASARHGAGFGAQQPR